MITTELGGVIKEDLETQISQLLKEIFSGSINTLAYQDVKDLHLSSSDEEYFHKYMLSSYCNSRLQPFVVFHRIKDHPDLDPNFMTCLKKLGLFKSRKDKDFIRQGKFKPSKI